MNLIDGIRYSFLVLLAVLICLGIFVFPSHLPQVLEWVRQQQLIGSLIFILLEAICIWCVSPVSIFIIAGGFMYGLWWGSLISYIGYLGGMLGAFLLGKTLLRESIQRWLYEKYPSYERIDRAIGAQGFKILVLFRLSPVMPCNVMNYICSLTSISFPSYALASIIGVIPTVFIYANIGAMIGNLSGVGFGSVEIPKQSKDMMILLSSVFTTLSVVLIGVISKKALREQLLPIEDERLDVEKEERFESSEAIVVQGFTVREKMTMGVVIVASTIALVVGSCIILQ